MKPESIFLIRHGESSGNVDKTEYSNTPDYAVTLTDRGIKQAKEAGKLLNNNCVDSDDKFAVYYSPFFRTIQTLNNIATQFPPKFFDKRWVREEPRLREQEWCGKLPIEGYSFKQEKERFQYGHFYYRFHGGESCSDVYDRVSDFMDTLHRDFSKPDYPKNALLVTHGMTLRVFLMRWLHKTVEEFESWGNPKNCEIFVLKKNLYNKYDLITPLKVNTNDRHEYKCKLEI